jgi:hypothetical protein
MEHFPETSYHDGILLIGAIVARDYAIADFQDRGIKALPPSSIAAVAMSAAAAEAILGMVAAETDSLCTVTEWLQDKRKVPV